MQPPPTRAGFIHRERERPIAATRLWHGTLRVIRNCLFLGRYSLACGSDVGMQVTVNSNTAQQTATLCSSALKHCRASCSRCPQAFLHFYTSAHAVCFSAGRHGVTRWDWRQSGLGLETVWWSSGILRSGHLQEYLGSFWHSKQLATPLNDDWLLVPQRARAHASERARENGEEAQL